MLPLPFHACSCDNHNSLDNQRNVSTPLFQLYDAHPNTAIPPLPEVVRSAGVAQTAMANGIIANIRQSSISSFLHTPSRLGNKDKHNQTTSPSPFDRALPFPPSPSSATTARSSEGDVSSLPTYTTNLVNHSTIKSAHAWIKSVIDRRTSLTTTSGGSSSTWKESSRSAEQQAPSAVSTVLPSPGAVSMSASIPRVDEDAHPKTPSSQSRTTCTTSIKKESTIGGLGDGPTTPVLSLFRLQSLASVVARGRENERESADAESKDEQPPTNPVCSPSQPQSLASAAVSANEAAFVANHVDEHRETPVRRPITSEQSRCEAMLGDLTNLKTALHEESLPDFVTLSDVLGLNQVWVCDLRGSSAANLADTLHCVRSSTACEYSRCLFSHYSDCERLQEMQISTPKE
jgi:hypothetical protein